MLEDVHAVALMLMHCKSLATSVDVVVSNCASRY